MSNKTQNSNEYEYQKVNVNKRQGYVCYTHPTKRSEKGNIKQVTRSIKEFKKDKEYDEEKLGILCGELDDLLVNFSTYTKDLPSIKAIHSNFKTKAFDWIISEHLALNQEQIINSTLEHFIPIAEYTPTVYFNASNSDLFQKYIPNIYKDEFELMVVNDKKASEFTAVVEFNEFKDLEEDTIEKIVLYINNIYSGQSVSEDDLNSYVKLDIKPNQAELFYKFANDIKELYMKEFKIKLDYCKFENFKVDCNVSNYIIKKLRNENSDLVSLIYNNIISSMCSKISTNDNFISYKLSKTDELPKILVFTSENESDFVQNLSYLFEFDNSSKYMKKLIKSMRIQGNFSKDNSTEKVHCLINQPNVKAENLVDYVTSSKIKICLDSMINNDLKLLELIERTIVFGGINDCVFYFEKFDFKGDYNFLTDTIIEFLNNRKLLRRYSHIYEREFNLTEKGILDHFIEGVITVHFMFSFKYETYKKFDELLFNIKTTFQTKVKEFFDDICISYVSQQSISKMVKTYLLESFFYSLFEYLFNISKLICYDDLLKHTFLSAYCEFILENLSEINAEIDSIIENELVMIFDKISNLDDYLLYKKSLKNFILEDVKIEYEFVKNIIDKLELTLNKKTSR